MANEHSQIVPSMQPTSTVADFKFWCQKVLPLVYDDSLSYYEVLNKMVVYLNQVIDNINADTANVAELEDDFLLLQTYVNNFFDDIDQLVTYTERAEAAQTAAAASAISAASSASNAATSASNSAGSASSAATSALSAMDAKDAAVAAKTAAEAALANAQTAATNAAASATTASNSATAAAGSATNASASATSAQQSFTLADVARTAAQTAAANAADSAAAAAASSADGTEAQVMIATEDTTTATSTHNIGEFFRMNGVLYVATDNIQIGDTITAGTNCRVAVVGDELSGLKTAFTEATCNLTDNATTVTGKYITNAGKLSTFSSGADRTICVEAKPNKIYHIKKSTSTVMRVGCGSSASLAPGDALTSYSGFESASDDELTVETDDTNYFIYIQLFAGSDSAELQTISANTPTLVIAEDFSAQIDELVNAFRNNYEGLINVAEYMVRIPNTGYVYRVPNTANYYGCYENIVIANGAPSASNNRIALTGTATVFSTGAPTYSTRPTWYVNEIPDFVVGHDYYFGCKLLSGTITDDGEVQNFVLYTQDQTLNNKSVSIGGTWTCTAMPQCIALNLAAGTYTNCVWYCYIIDKTLSSSSDATNMFNGEPYTGTYDWQTPVAAYGALFKGKTNVESFAYFTDPHVMGFADDNRNETNMANYFKKVQNTINATPCSFTICGGDLLNNSTTMDEACYRLGYVKGIFVHLLDGCKLVLGNHDTNYRGKQTSGSDNGTGQLTNATIASIMFRDTNTKKAYYSFDGSNSKCYVLDTGIDSHDTMLDYDWEQVAWLAEKLASDDPTHAIIFMHIILHSDAVQINATNFGTLVQAYNAHTTVTLNSIEYDFTNCTGHVDFFVAGHNHEDVTGTLGGIPYFTTDTNSYESDTPLIDLALVDYDNSVLYLKRVGGTGSDRTINLA